MVWPTGGSRCTSAMSAARCPSEFRRNGSLCIGRKILARAPEILEQMGGSVRPADQARAVELAGPVSLVTLRNGARGVSRENAAAVPAGIVFVVGLRHGWGR